MGSLSPLLEGFACLEKHFYIVKDKIRSQLVHIISIRSDEKKFILVLIGNAFGPHEMKTLERATREGNV